MEQYMSIKITFIFFKSDEKKNGS